jgi:hypothetical protein
MRSDVGPALFRRYGGPALELLGYRTPRDNNFFDGKAGMQVEHQDED